MILERGMTEHNENSIDVSSHFFAIKLHHKFCLFCEIWPHDIIYASIYNKYFSFRLSNVLMLHYVEKNGELVTDVMSKCIKSHVRLLLFEIKQSLFFFNFNFYLNMNG